MYFCYFSLLCTGLVVFDTRFKYNWNRVMFFLTIYRQKWLSYLKVDNVSIQLYYMGSNSKSIAVCKHRNRCLCLVTPFYHDGAVRSLGIPLSANRRLRLPRRHHWKAVRCRSTTHGQLCKLDRSRSPRGFPDSVVIFHSWGLNCNCPGAPFTNIAWL